MARRQDFVLLLTFMTSVFCGLLAEALVVDTAPNVLGWKWDDTRLPCAFQEAEPLAVTWDKETITGQLETKAVFFDGNFESREERFIMNRNFSLVITDLEVADEGLYICQVALSESQIFENFTLVTVNSMASRHVIEECVYESLTSQSQCTYQTPSDTSSFNLTCVVSGFKPNISIFWTEESGKRLNSTISQQITLSDDTYERFETITVSSTHQEEQTFICIATGDPLNGTSTTGIYILPISGKSNNFGLAFGLTFVVLAVVILVLLVGIFLQRHNTYLVRKECGLCPCWRLFKTQRPDVESMIMESLPDNSLTDEQVQQCKNDLKVYYRKTRRKVTVDPLNFMERVNLDEIYTNLSLIDKSSMRRTPITYEDLLTNDEIGNLSKRLLIQGEGGVGKTTLCAKIAWDWCQERILQDLDMVIVIPLRDVTVDKTIGGIVERYLSDSNEATPAQINDYISTNLSKVLLVFDGFDEFNEKIKGHSGSEVIRILGLEQYESCKVIVTSRPWRTDEFKLYKSLAVAYTFISVEGFNKENLSTYIRRYFRIRDRDALAESLLNFMDENDVIRCNMAPFPIYCAMLCLMWNDFSEERRKGLQKLQTFSEIFGEMITFLKEHYASKFCENLQTQNIPEDIEEANTAIQAISETALYGLLERKLSFPEKQFKMCHVAMETCCKVGILTIEKDVDRKRRRDANHPSSFVASTVSFPHKLFQEYIAGVHIVTLFADNRSRYNKVKKKLLGQCEEFRYLLYFATAAKKEPGLDIIDGLIKKGDQYFCIDVAFECHTEEAARAVGKRWKDYKLSRDMSEHTKAGVVFMGNCNQAETLLINDVSCGKTVSRYLAEGMCSSSLLRKVTLENPRLHTDFYMIMGTKASNCQIQDLTLTLRRLDYGSQHQSSMAGDLAQWVCTMPRLSSFSLTWYYLDGDFLSKAIALQSSSQIQDLTLTLGRLDNGSQHQSSMAGDLAQWVCTMPRLLSFSLTWHDLEGDFISKAIALQSSSQIQTLKISFQKFGDGSQRQSLVWRDLTQWVFTMPSLSSFSMTCPYLDSTFLAKAAASASACQIKSNRWTFNMPGFSIFSVQCSYKDISVFKQAAFSASCCQIQDLKLTLGRWYEGSQHQSSMAGDLAQWVCTMPSLSSFSLTFDYMDGDFLSKAIALQSSSQIQDLKLTLRMWYEGSQHQSSMAGDLAQWVCTMPSLSSFSLTCNYLDGVFLSKAIALQSSSQIQDLTLITCDDDFYCASSAPKELAQWVCTLPRLSSFSLECVLLQDDGFFSTAAKLAQSCQIRKLSLKFKEGWMSRSPTSAANFAGFLYHMPHLESVDITCRNLPESFFKVMASHPANCKFEDITINDKPLNQWLSDKTSKKTTH